jgi:hypothetical protein
MGWVGLVSRPEAKVSPERRKLNSAGAKGRGMGESGRISSRSTQAVKPTRKTERARLRASAPKRLSSFEKNPELARVQLNAMAMVISVKPASIRRSEGPPGVVDACIREFS